MRNEDDRTVDLLEVRLKDDTSFLKIRETLTRIGVATVDPTEDSDEERKKLVQVCHILHKKGRYYITHYKELLRLDGRDVEPTRRDVGRRNRIALLLEEWNLLEIVDIEAAESLVAPISQIKVLSYKEKDDWELVTNYNIGKSKRR